MQKKTKNNKNTLNRNHEQKTYCTYYIANWNYVVKSRNNEMKYRKYNNKLKSRDDMS